MSMENFCKSRDLSQWTGGCNPDFGVIDYIIFTPSKISITETDAEDLIGFLRDASDPIIAADKRFYPVYGDAKRVTDESSEPTIGSLDKGYTRQLLPGRAIYLLEWPSGMVSDKFIDRLNRFNGGCLIINDQRMLIGTQNIDGSMGALPVEVTAVFGGGFAGSGGDIQTKRLRIDLGAQNKLSAGVMAYMFNEDDRFENIIPSPAA